HTRRRVGCDGHVGSTLSIWPDCTPSKVDTMADYETVALDVDEDGIATVTLDRPAVLNAFNLTMQRELIEVFDRTDGDDGVRAVVVTGRGRAFCAGADLSSGGDTFDYESRAAENPAGFVDGVHRDG